MLETLIKYENQTAKEASKEGQPPSRDEATINRSANFVFIDYFSIYDINEQVAKKTN